MSLIEVHTVLTCRQIWGEAYRFDGPASALYTFKSFASHEPEIAAHEYFSAHQYSHYVQGQYFGRGTFGIDWPSAIQYPLFYVGIYAVIGLANAITGVISVAAQYTGALRASRVLFRSAHVTVSHPISDRSQAAVGDRRWCHLPLS